MIRGYKKYILADKEEPPAPADTPYEKLFRNISPQRQR